jgi:hypothetical protein
MLPAIDIWIPFFISDFFNNNLTRLNFE